MAGKSMTEQAQEPNGYPHDTDEHPVALKRVALVVAGAVAFLALMYGLAAVLVTLFLDPATLSRWVEPRMEAALNREVELEGAQVRLFPVLGAELYGVEVANLPDFRGPPLATIDRIRLDLAILPLFQGRVRMNEVRIEGPRVRAAVDADGVSNYGDLVPESREVGEDESSGRLELAIREIVVRDGSLTYENLPDTVALSVAGLDAEASVQRSRTGGWSGDLAARSDSMLVGHPALGPGHRTLDGPGLRGGASAAEDFEWIELVDGVLALGSAQLSLRGRLDGLKEPTRRVDLVLTSEQLPVSSVLALLPDSAYARVPGQGTGTLGIDLRAEGMVGPEERPSVRGEIRLRDVGLVGRDSEVLAEEIGGRIEVREEGIAFREVQGTVLEGPFAMDGTVATDSLMPFQLSVAMEPRLELAGAFLTLPEEAHLAGLVSAEVGLSGRVREVHRSRIEGGVDVNGLRLEHPGMGVPLTVESAGVAFEGERGILAPVTVALGDDALRVSGTLVNPFGIVAPPGEALPHLEVEVAGARLDLDRVLPPRGDTAVTYGQIAFARMGGRSIQGRSAEAWAAEKELERPRPFPLSGEATIRLDTLISAPFRAEDLRATVGFSPTVVEVSDARFTLYGGDVTTGLRMGLGGEASEPFTLRVRAQGVRGEEFLAATSPLGRHVSGLLDLELDVAGGMDRSMLPLPGTVSGEARTEVRDGRLEETPLTRALARGLSLPALTSPSISRWISRMELSGSTVRFLEANLDTELGPLAYGGSMGLDGSLDLGLRISVASSRLDSLALEQSGFLGAVAGRLAGGGGPLRLGIAVGGTLENPEIAPRASLATGEMGESLRDLATERVESVRDTAEARLEAVRDTARERFETARDTARARAEAERRRLEERARREADEARRELEQRARDVLGGFVRPEPPADTGGERVDTTGTPPPDTPGASPSDSAAASPDSVSVPGSERPSDTTNAGETPEPEAPEPGSAGGLR